MRRRRFLGALVAPVATAYGAAPKGPQWLGSPVPKSIDDFSSLLPGHNFRRLAEAAADLPRRDQFESEAAFRERCVLVAKRPIAGAVALSDRLAFQVPFVRSDVENGFVWGYDADSQLARFSVSGEIEWPGWSTVGFKVLQSDLIAEPMGKPYFATNAMGVKTMVSRQRATQWRLLCHLNTFRSEFASQVIEMPGALAKQLLPKAAVLVVGRAAPPYGMRSDDYFAPKIHHPYETVLKRFDFTMIAEEIIVFSGDRVLCREHIQDDDLPDHLKQI